jgi:hypothetical protein
VESDLSYLSFVLNFIKWLSKAVSGYLSYRDVLEVDFAVLNLILNIVIVDINMLRTLIITLRGDELNRRLIVAKELKRGDVCAKIIKLAKQLNELGGFLRAERKANVLCLSSWGSNKTLLARLVADSAASEFKEVTIGRLAILRVSKQGVAVRVESEILVVSR